MVDVAELRKNQVLANLSEAVLNDVARRLTREVMATWQLFRDEGAPISRVHFPVDSVISIVSLSAEGSVAEAYAVGRDGIAGVELALEQDRTIHRTMCQVPGVAYSMSAAGFLELLAAHTEFQHQVDLYLHCLIAMLGRSGSCNLMHDVPERCARWLLSTRDRVGGDQFTLTQEVLATMLGVHRPAVTLAAGALQKAGLIRYSRGQIAIVDADGLREASCECYGIVADEFRRVLGGP